MTFADKFAVALCLWREARGESPDAIRAVMHVINNRVQDGRWPNTFAGVVLQPKQFSSFNANDPNVKKYPALNESAWLKCCCVVDFPGDDPTNGANHYESIKDPKKRPAWADPAKVTAEIGAFRFYRL